MHEAGHVDLRAVAEDGTKLRANASPASFHNADEIADIVKQLRGESEERLARVNTAPEGQMDVKADVALVGLRRRLARAEKKCCCRVAGARAPSSFQWHRRQARAQRRHARAAHRHAFSVTPRAVTS